MDAYLAALFRLAMDPSSDVRKSLCQALVMLLEVALDKLMPHMREVVQYMLRATADEDEYVALEACEFWSSICETKVTQPCASIAMAQSFAMAEQPWHIMAPSWPIRPSRQN